jgi:hypothetical protein
MVARDKAALGGAHGVAAKTRARLDCGRWVSGGDDRDRRCCAPTGVVVWLGPWAALSWSGLRPLRAGAR